MKFKFNLEKVLKHRKTVENIAQADFQEALAQLKREEDRLRQMHDQVHQTRLIIHQLQNNNHGPNASPEIYQIQNSENFIKLQALRIDKQGQIIALAKKLVEEKREILRSRATDSKILERLKEKKKEEFVQEFLRKEQHELDEMSIMRVRLKDK